MPEESWRGNRNANNSGVTINNLGKTSIVLLAIFSGLAVGIAITALITNIRESQLLRDHQNNVANELRDHQALMMAQYQHELDHYKEEFVKLERQYRMMELKLDDWTVVAHRSGMVLPGDYARGPQGNLDAASFNIPQQKPKGK